MQIKSSLKYRIKTKIYRGTTLYNKLPVHAKSEEFRQYITPNIYDKLYSFCVVRNPWDWQFSIYNFALKTKKHFRHEFFKKLVSFDSYIRWRCSNDGPFELQSDFIKDKNGNLLVNKIIKFENLDNDFNTVLEELGLPSLKLSKMRSVSQRRNSYKDSYDDELINLVSEKFSTDIKLFDYSF